MIDGGISNAKWSPDYTNLLIVTNNDSIICMNCNWDLLYEIPMISSRDNNSLSEISFKGDGELFAILTTDSINEDNALKGTTYIRIYNKELELLTTCKNIADGSASIMKGIGNTLAFSPNGSYVATHQQRIKSKHQVILSEVIFMIHDNYFTLFISIIDCIDREERFATWRLRS